MPVPSHTGEAAATGVLSAGSVYTPCIWKLSINTVPLPELMFNLIASEVGLSAATGKENTVLSTQVPRLFNG